jgi:hypothetical protein
MWLFHGCGICLSSFFAVASHVPVYLRLSKHEGQPFNLFGPRPDDASTVGGQVGVAMICKHVFSCNYGCDICLSVNLIEWSCFTDVASASPCFCCCLACACPSSTAQTRGSSCEPFRRRRSTPRRFFNRWVAGWCSRRMICKHILL